MLHKDVADGVGDADDGDDEADDDDGEVGPLDVAQLGAAARVADDDEAEHSQRHRQPDGNGVHHHAEDGEEHEVLRVAEGGRGASVDVVVEDGVREVGRHSQAVRDGQPRQQDVGRGHHVLAGQDDDVEAVGDDAEHADDWGRHSVDGAIPRGEHLQIGRCRGDVAHAGRVVTGHCQDDV